MALTGEVSGLVIESARGTEQTRDIAGSTFVLTSVNPASRRMPPTVVPALMLEPLAAGHRYTCGAQYSVGKVCEGCTHTS